ncbi:MAG TPA: serine hydrolase domain-containing protein, partial [Gemmatimonadales bacterium]|nr:serine hydrolase domain-containing protein [Gemmatimonadales bacterium]
MPRPIVIALLLSIPLTTRAECQRGRGSGLPGWPAFGQALDEFARQDSVVGAGTVYVSDGRVLAHHEYGWADRAGRERTEERTIYHWASITKTLTAIAIMQL